MYSSSSRIYFYYDNKHMSRFFFCFVLLWMGAQAITSTPDGEKPNDDTNLHLSTSPTLTGVLAIHNTEWDKGYRFEPAEVLRRIAAFESNMKEVLTRLHHLESTAREREEAAYARVPFRATNTPTTSWPNTLEQQSMPDPMPIPNDLAWTSYETKCTGSIESCADAVDQKPDTDLSAN